jgi:hypothetical protein
MKSKLKGRRFHDVTEIQEKSLTVLHAIPKCQFQRCFQQWQKRWSHCINWEGDTLKETATSNTKVSVYFVVGSVRELLDTPSYTACSSNVWLFARYSTLKMEAAWTSETLVSCHNPEDFGFSTCSL